MVTFFTSGTDFYNLDGADKAATGLSGRPEDVSGEHSVRRVMVKNCSRTKPIDAFTPHASLEDIKP